MRGRAIVCDRAGGSPEGIMEASDAMVETVTIPDMIVFLAACTLVGGPLLALAAMLAHAMRRGMSADDAGPMTCGAVDGEVATIAAHRDDGSFVCLCSHEVRDDGRGRWDSLTFVDIVDEACPIHGPAGDGWEFLDITTTSDEGRTRCIRGERSARSAQGRS